MSATPTRLLELYLHRPRLDIFIEKNFLDYLPDLLYNEENITID